MINLINVSTQNNFCGYYVLARRIINDNNFCVIRDKFNQFYQTNWYQDQLAEIVGKMNSEQAEIMLGLVIHNEHPPKEVGNGLYDDELESICEAFWYKPAIFFVDSEDYSDSIKATLEAPLAPNEILISFDSPKDKLASIGHFNLIEPDIEKFAKDASLRDPCYEGHIHSINNQGGDTETFINNIKKSVAKIKPNWTDELKQQQIQADKTLAWNYAVEEAQRINLSFFSNGHVNEEEKARVIELQSKEIEHYNKLLRSK